MNLNLTFHSVAYVTLAAQNSRTMDKNMLKGSSEANCWRAILVRVIYIQRSLCRTAAIIPHCFVTRWYAQFSAQVLVSYIVWYVWYQVAHDKRKTYLNDSLQRHIISTLVISASAMPACRLNSTIRWIRFEGSGKGTIAGTGGSAYKCEAMYSRMLRGVQPTTPTKVLTRVPFSLINVTGTA